MLRLTSSPTTIKGAVIYIRVSTKEQIEGNSLAVQREACLRYAEERGLKVEEIFVEEGESAKVADRTQLLKLMKFCSERKGQVGALIVWKIDRFARNASDHFHVKAALLRSGVAIHSVTEPIDDSHMGKMMETILAGWAEFDNAIRAERVTAGMHKKIEQGIWPWRPPLGYLAAGTTSRGEKKNEPDKPDPESFELVKRVRKEFLKGIHRLSSITRYAERIGLRLPSGKPPREQTLERILRNPFYAGLLLNPWTREEVQGLHEPMVTPDEHAKTLQILKGRSVNTAPRDRSNPDFPLRQFVACARDGRGYTGSWSTGRSARYAYYRCIERRCDYYRHSTKKAELEDQFLQFLGSVTPKSEYLNLFKAVVINVWNQKRQELNGDALRHERRLKEIEQAKLDFIKGKGLLLSDQEFLAIKAQYDDEIAATRRSLEESRMEDSDLPSAVEFAIQAIQGLPQLWFNHELEQQQRFQKLVFPKGVTYEPKLGFGTAEIGLIYEVARQSEVSESRLVHLMIPSWNRLVRDLRIWEQLRPAASLKLAA